jgi:hypothetical protein
MAVAHKVQCRPAAFRSARAAAPIRIIRPVALPARRTVSPCRAIDIDISDPDTQVALAGCLLGVLFGIGAPIWYTNRTEVDNARLEELRALNRATFEETGEYMSDTEIEKFRKPKWTDRR